MLYAAAAVERAMKIQEVICRALAGTLTWIQGAEILGIDTRSLRRWRARYEREASWACMIGAAASPPSGADRGGRACCGCIASATGGGGFNVRHFHYLARRDHGVTLSYTFVKLALQEAGLVRKGRSRGRHRRRREPRPCFGELLHLDGSRHAWLARCPTEQHTLIAVLDDATKRLLYAQLWPGETTAAVMSALRDGLPDARAARSRCIPTAPPGPSTPPPPAARSISRAPRSSAAPSRTSASSTSPATRPRPAAAASGSTAPCRAGSSTSSAWPASPPWRPPMPTCAPTSSPTTTPSSVGRRPTPPAPSCRSKPSGHFTCQQQRRAENGLRVDFSWMA